MASTATTPSITAARPNVSKLGVKQGGTSKAPRPMTRTLMMMPDDILTMVLSLCTYDEISQLRMICHRFNRICQRLLNQGLQKLERYHSNCLKKLKSQLPRRESERRQHPLARHCDILSAVETRLSLLAMTYSKYIDLKVCCFIPGKVVDEAMRVLTLVMNSKEAPRTHDLLQELRDISSMAMEHFDEKIAPGLRKKLSEGQPVHATTIGAALTLKDISQTSPVMPSTSGRQMNKLHHQIKTANYNFSEVVKDMKALKSQVLELRKVRYEQEKKITQQQQVMVELSSKVTSQNERITEQERKMALLEQQLRNVPGTSQEPQVYFTIDEDGGSLEDECKDEKGTDIEEGDDKLEASRGNLDEPDDVNDTDTQDTGNKKKSTGKKPTDLVPSDNNEEETAALGNDGDVIEDVSTVSVTKVGQRSVRKRKASRDEGKNTSSIVSKKRRQKSDKGK
ncbi:F-box only protein 28 [Holothuria leucospilota]|uniref:F-box only protein 28 n=1 Tax=Holothuria leucospilota TaxID=206669 RepID=A0A9Q1CIA6_HOLLE|nr:F-box only protein 28 [Holothuria leucospilota]